MHTLPVTSYPMAARQSSERPATRPVTILLVVAARERERFPAGNGTTITVHSTTDAMQRLEETRPHVVVVDWDYQTIDAAAICRAATARQSTMVMVTTESTTHVVTALKAGCHAVLLKPFAPNLAAARLGRLCREATTAMSPAYRAMVERGTNRTCPDVACPQCRAGDAISFDHASYRRSWYACLACEHVWLGMRQE